MPPPPGKKNHNNNNKKLFGCRRHSVIVLSSLTIFHGCVCAIYNFWLLSFTIEIKNVMLSSVAPLEYSLTKVKLGLRYSSLVVMYALVNGWIRFTVFLFRMAWSTLKREERYVTVKKNHLLQVNAVDNILSSTLLTLNLPLLSISGVWNNCSNKTVTRSCQELHNSPWWSFSTLV